MGCLKGKDQCKPKEASVRCGKCGALAEKKGKVCKPEKLAAKNHEGKDDSCDEKPVGKKAHKEKKHHGGNAEKIMKHHHQDEGHHDVEPASKKSGKKQCKATAGEKKCKLAKDLKEKKNEKGKHGGRSKKVALENDNTAQEVEELGAEEVLLQSLSGIKK